MVDSKAIFSVSYFPSLGKVSQVVVSIWLWCYVEAYKEKRLITEALIRLAYAAISFVVRANMFTWSFNIETSITTQFYYS